MKYTSLILAALLICSSSFAQYYEPEKVQVENETKLNGIWSFKPAGNKLVFIASSTRSFRNNTLYYIKGNNVVRASDNLLKDLKVFHLAHYTNPSPDGKLYFSAFNKHEDGKQVYVWDGVNAIEKVANVGIGGSPSSSDITFTENKMYFTGYDYEVSLKQNYLFELDLNTYALKQLTDTTYDPAGVIAIGDKLFFVLYNSNKFLYEYNTTNGEIKHIPLQTDAAYLDSKYITSTLIALDNKLYLVASSHKLGSQLYEYDGKSFSMIEGFAKGEVDGVSGAVAYNGKIYFSGNKNETEELEEFNLYSYDPYTKNVEQITHYKRDKKTSFNPYYFHVAEDQLYFTAYEPNTELQLYTYNSNSNMVRRITNHKWEGENPQPILTQYHNGSLYFKGNWGFTSNENIYHLNLNEQPTSIGNIPYGNVTVTLQPNPVKDVATMNISLPHADKIHLSVVDMGGRLVHEHYTISTQQQHHIQIPMQHLPAGTYVYQLMSNNGQLLHSGQLIRE